MVVKNIDLFCSNVKLFPLSWCKPVRNRNQENSVGTEIKSSPTSINARQMSVTNNRTVNRFAINCAPMTLNCKEMLKSVLMLSKFPRMTEVFMRVVPFGVIRFYQNRTNIINESENIHLRRKSVNSM